jgi:hypothetical protein
MSKFIKKGMQGLNFFSFGSCSVEAKPIVIDEDDDDSVQNQPISKEPKPTVIDEDDDDSVQKQPISKKPKNKLLQEGKKTPQIDEDENMDYDVALRILKIPLYEIKNKKVYFIDLKDLKHLNLMPYRHQREYNQDHVDVLKKGLIQTGYLYHPIVLIHIPERKEISIIDGQHRFKALKSILEIAREAQGDVDIQVQIEMIECEDDDSKVMNIYKNVNTCQPIDMNKIVLEEDYVKVIQKLKSKFGKDAIKENTRNFKHYIIESNLKKELMSHNLLTKYSEDELIKRIIRMNDDLKEKQKLLCKLPEGTLKTCEKNNFWLGTNFPNWLKEL